MNQKIRFERQIKKVKRLLFNLLMASAYLQWREDEHKLAVKKGEE